MAQPDSAAAVSAPPSGASAKPAAETPSGAQSSQAAGGTDDAWAQAMASGRDAQAQYLASLQNIFDQFWGAGPDRR